MIPDLTGKSFEDIRRLREDPTTGEPLRRALDRYLASLDDPDGVVAAFGSFVE